MNPDLVIAIATALLALALVPTVVSQVRRRESTISLSTAGLTTVCLLAIMVAQFDLGLWRAGYTAAVSSSLWGLLTIQALVFDSPQERRPWGPFTFQMAVQEIEDPLTRSAVIDELIEQLGGAPASLVYSEYGYVAQLLRIQEQAKNEHHAMVEAELRHFHQLTGMDALEFAKSLGEAAALAEEGLLLCGDDDQPMYQYLLDVYKRRLGIIERQLQVVKEEQVLGIDFAAAGGPPVSVLLGHFEPDGSMHITRELRR